MAVVTPELREKREALVIEHMETENEHDYVATIETFDHPRYELIGTGVSDRVSRPAKRVGRAPPRR